MSGVVWRIDQLTALCSGEYSVSVQDSDGAQQTLSYSTVEASDELDEQHNKFPLVIGADGSLQLFDTRRGRRLWTAQFDAAVVSAHG